MMARAPQLSPAIAYSPMTVPSGAMRPILLEKFSVNQRSPSGATVTPRSDASGVFTGHSVTRPCASMRPSALALVSTNQMLPSGCVTMARGSQFGVGSWYSVTWPSMLMRPICPASYSLNQRSPSRTTSESGRQPGVRPVGEFRHGAARRDPAEPADMGFGEPDISVRARDDAVRPGARRSEAEIR